MYKASVLLLLFLLELCAVAALAWWGFTADTSVWMRVVLGVGAPLVAVLLWGLFAAPQARIRASGAVVVMVKVIVYAAATVAIAATGHIALSVLYLGLVLLATGLIWLGRLDAGDRTSSDVESAPAREP